MSKINGLMVIVKNQRNTFWSRQRKKSVYPMLTLLGKNNLEKVRIVI